MRREIKLRVTASLSVAPAIVSDLTSPQVVGLEPRQFRDFLRTAGVPHATVGRRVLARVEDVVAAIERLSSRGSIEQSGESSADEPSADELLARVGRRRTCALPARAPTGAKVELREVGADTPSSGDHGVAAGLRAQRAVSERRRA